MPETVVVVHGIDGSAKASERIARNLFPGHAFVVYDLPGRGEDRRVPTSHSLETYVEHLEGRELPRRFCLVGYSMGGVIAASYAMRYPKRVTRLVLLCPAGRVSSAARLSASVPFAVWRLLVPRLMLSSARSQYPKAVVRQKERLYADVRFLRVLYDTLREFPLHDVRLRRVRVPAVAIAADGDTIVPARAVRQVAAELGARLVVVTGTHAAPLTSPNTVKRALDAWMKGAHVNLHQKRGP